MNRYQLVLFLLLLGLSIAAFADCTKADFEPVDLDTYYQDAIGQSGQALKSTLNQIVKGHQAYSYTPCVWEILEEADEDPNNSDNVIGLYTNRSIPKSERDRGGNTPDAWNREHVWSKSKGFPSKSQDAHNDAHHVRAADKSVNADRGNRYFANGGAPNSECTECREGDDDTWEAPDHVKGDIARMMFYMAVRYEGNDGSNTPDLELVDEVISGGEPRFGKLCILLEWHQQDAVSESERRRNDIVFSWQGNRNPFIDHPEFVQAIWGEACGVEPVDPVEPPDPTSPKELLLERIDRLEAELEELRRLVEESL